MTETVFSFIEIFGEETFRSVAGITGRHVFMRTFEPTFILVAHYMAVHTSFRIILKVGIALTVNKSVGPKAQDKTDQCSENKNGREM